MIEKTVRDLLLADATLVSKISTYESEGAVFSDVAPKDAVLPYIVFDITKTSTDSLIIDAFRIEFDIYSSLSSSTTTNETIREITERIEYATDIQLIETDSRFGAIRFYRGSQGYVYDKDSEVSHYNMIVEARGTRKKWNQQI